MRIVVMSDTHGLHRSLRVPEGDVLIHCGDLATTFLGDDRIGKAKDGLDWLNEQKHKHILFVPGNHDTVYGQHWFNLGRVVWLNGEARIGGLRICGQGWGRKYEFEHCDILVSHVPAYGILDEQQGCRELRRRIKSYPPLLHVFGHVHGAHGQRRVGLTRFCNAALLDDEYRIVRQPSVIELGVNV